MNRLLLALLLAAFGAAACTNGGAFNHAAESTAPAAVVSGFSVTPDPAAPQALVRYALHRDVSAVTLSIYDASGDFIRRYDDLPVRATAGTVVARAWDLADFEGRPVAAGLYVVKLALEAGETTWKLTQTLVVP